MTNTEGHTDWRRGLPAKQLDNRKVTLQVRLLYLPLGCLVFDKEMLVYSKYDWISSIAYVVGSIGFLIGSIADLVEKIVKWLE